MVIVHFTLLKSSTLLSFTIVLCKNNCTKYIFLTWGYCKSALQEEHDFLLVLHRSIRNGHCSRTFKMLTDYTLENDELFSSLVREAL